MKRFKFAALVSASFIFASSVCAQDGPPKAAVHDITDSYFGQTIVDPYRWMEDSKSADTAAWMKAESQYTRAYLDPLPLRADLLKRLSELSDAGVRVSGVKMFFSNSPKYFS